MQIGTRKVPFPVLIVSFTVWMVCSGCGPPITFQHPLVPPEKAVLYSELLGDFAVSPQSDPGHDEAYRITAAGDAFPPGFMLVTTSPRQKEQDHQITPRLAFCFRHQEDFYMHFPLRVKRIEDPAKAYFTSDWSLEETEAFEIFRARRLADGHFHCAFMAPDFLKKEIEAGHLEGLVTYTNADHPEVAQRSLKGIYVTAKPAELLKYLQFLKQHNVQGLFPGGGSVKRMTTRQNSIQTTR